MRLKIVPFLLPLFFKFAAVRHSMFRTISQAAVNYRGSSLSEGRAGAVHGGDRLPWVKTELNGFADNFAPLTSLDWQVHVYGDASAEIKTFCADRKLPLHIFPWRPEMGRAGLRRNAVYLLRPDGYVALADSEGRCGGDHFLFRRAQTYSGEVEHRLAIGVFSHRLLLVSTGGVGSRFSPRHHFHQRNESVTGRI